MPRGTSEAYDSTSFTLRKLARFLDLNDDQVAAFEELRGHTSVHHRNADLVRTGERHADVLLLESGWAMRYKLLPDGRRQIINFHIPGDLVCLDAHVLPVADYTVCTLSDCVVNRISRDKFSRWVQSHPELGMAAMLLHAREDAALAEQLVSLGRRTAYERMACLLQELCSRMDLIDAARDGSYAMPLTQPLIADTLGLSTVHVNRTLRALADEGILKIQSTGHLTLKILKPDALQAITGRE